VLVHSSTMKRSHGAYTAFFQLVGVFALAACGAATPPPPQAGAPSSLATTPAESGSNASEPPPSPDLAAGIKAFDAGNYAEARKAFESATRKNPGDYDASYNLGMACEKLGDKAAAEAAYKSALATKPELEAAATELCALYLDEGRVDDALAVGRAALAKHPASGALHENLAVALASHNEHDSAIHEFEEAVKAQPSEVMFQLTFAHWLNAWHAGGAAPHLDAARELAKGNYGMIASVGHEYRMAGEFESCIKTFDRAIQLKDGGEVRTERALCKLGMKDEKGAIDDLEGGVTAEPSYAPAHYYLGGRLALTKRFKDAAAEYAKYLDLAPSGSLAKLASERMKAAQDAAKTGKPGKKKL
jgi:tetratricopeptide (TPR) repeat protein